MPESSDNAPVVNQPTLDAEEAKPQPIETPDVKQSNVPYSRFKEVNDQLKDMKIANAQLKQKEDEREKEAKLKAGEFKELYEASEQRANKFEKENQKHNDYFSERKKQIMSDWSDEDKELYGGLPFDKLERHNDNLIKTKSVKTNTSKSGVSQGKPFKGDIWDDSDPSVLAEKRRNFKDIIKNKVFD